MKAYYKAYDKRYKQVHNRGLTWASNKPTATVEKVIDKYNVTCSQKILEIGCGEGRDATNLLQKGYNLTATDVSAEAIDYCKRKNPNFADNFCVQDACKDKLTEKYDFIYCVAVIHMLVEGSHRNALISFIYEHLKTDGKALIMSMGDGVTNSQTDPKKAFIQAKRTHSGTGRQLMLASTTCKIVDFDTLLGEVKNAKLNVIEYAITSEEDNFSTMMYVVAEK